MGKHELEPGGQRPYFAEIPYYVWGQVNYDSNGDCDRPRSRDWTWMELTNRETEERLSISIADTSWQVEGSEPAAARVAHFLSLRLKTGTEVDLPIAADQKWNPARASARAAAVAKEFERPELDAFDSQLFWGSWKWSGWFATSFTLIGRLIMHSVVRRDTRAVSLCVDWLRSGTFSPDQSTALRSALRLLTGDSFESDREWIVWYDGDNRSRGHRQEYPEPDIDAWLAQLKAVAADSAS